jgi:hypothetical protein
MTALCGGGTSAPKSNTAVDVILTATQLASFLTGKVALWAAIASGALGVLTFETGVFCSSDPPAQPTITADEYKALLELGPPELFQSALAKLRDLVLIAMWYELCACTSVATPQPPANLYTPPAGVGVQDYTTTPCANPTLRVNFPQNAFNYDDTSNITRQLFPNLQFTRSAFVNVQYPDTDVAVLPSNWVSAHADANFISGTATGPDTYSVELLSYGADKHAGAVLLDVATQNSRPVDRAPDTGDFVFNHSTTSYFGVFRRAGLTVSAPGVVDYSLTLNCGSPSAAAISCGTDPILQALLNQILELCQRTREDVTLIQRYALPFAYVRGPSISGLTGTGSMALGRSVGLLIDVLGFPPANKQMLGEPPYIFDLGWVSALTPDGLVDEIRLTREHTTWLSKLIPSAELVGWGLRDGVQIRITELHAEP